MTRIGPYILKTPVVLAPMAGITDQPFRHLCMQYGASLAYHEMLTSQTELWQSQKSRTKLPHANDKEPRAVQIVGNDPDIMALAAKSQVHNGAQIIDINMGCPAKKVCQKAAGSALLRDIPLVREIITKVVNAVSIPVTLKIRTGWDHNSRNALEVALLAQNLGIQVISIHGRTRADRFMGEAEYFTIADVKSRVSIPIFANGDIDSVQKAQEVLKFTKADAIMIGRASLGRPWIFGEIIKHFNIGSVVATPISYKEACLQHIDGIHHWYGETMGCRIARKHVAWYLSHHQDGQFFCKMFNNIEKAQEQIEVLEGFLDPSIGYLSSNSLDAGTSVW